MAVVGCYTLDLYCDGPCEKSDAAGYTKVSQFTGHTEGDCIKQARERGWKFNRDKTKAYCPKCSKSN